MTFVWWCSDELQWNTLENLFDEGKKRGEYLKIPVAYFKIMGQGLKSQNTASSLHC